jgi:hypothetical protein
MPIWNWHRYSVLFSSLFGIFFRVYPSSTMWIGAQLGVWWISIHFWLTVVVNLCCHSRLFRDVLTAIYVLGTLSVAL